MGPFSQSNNSRVDAVWYNQLVVFLVNAINLGSGKGYLIILEGMTERAPIINSA